MGGNLGAGVNRHWNRTTCAITGVHRQAACDFPEIGIAITDVQGYIFNEVQGHASPNIPGEIGLRYAQFSSLASISLFKASVSGNPG
jgi:hypothetical protein